MKKLLLSIFLIGSLPSRAQCPNGLSGTYSIGPSGNFPSIEASIDTLTRRGLAGAVILELQPNYASAAEVFPIKLPLLNCANGSRTVTIRPSATAGNIIINSSNDTATLDVRSGSYYIIDGRSGGMGTAKNLTISNTHVNGVALRLVNDASYNSFKYLDLKGVNTSPFSGVVHIGYTNLEPTACNYNRIDTCLIHEGSTPPANGVYIAGVWGKIDTGIVINGCQIYNFYSRNDNSHGIYVNMQAHKLTITNNHFYQALSNDYRGFPSRVFGIRIYTPYLGGHVVSNNFIGGTAPSATGQKMSLKGSFIFTGIDVTDGTGVANVSHVDSNVVSNLSFYSDGSYSYANSMISLGYANWTSVGFTGTCLNNVVGSPMSDTAITFRTDGGQPTVYGISGSPQCSLLDSVVVQNNIVSGIYADSLSAGPVDVFGMNFDYGGSGLSRLFIQNNVVGSPTKPRSLNNRSGGWAGGIRLFYNLGKPSETTVRDNIIANISSVNPSGISRGSVHGIAISGEVNGILNVINNTIHHLHLKVGSHFSPSAGGIVVTGAGTGNFIGNRIYQLSSIFLASTTSGNSVNGITINNGNVSSTNKTTTVSKNLIHSLQAGENSSSGHYNVGILVANANNTTNVENNMIRLGLDSAGKAMTYAQTIYGIEERSGKNNFIHNSVYIGGANAEPSYTAAYESFSSSTLRSVRNNIFVNQRSSTTGGNTHACVSIGPLVTFYLDPSMIQPPQLPASMNNNLYFFNASGRGFLGFDGLTRLTLSDWQQATGKDSNSKFADPLFINAVGNVQAVNLHLNTLSPAESAGSTTGTAVEDFDGDARANLTPVDVGADAGNFTCNSFTIPSITISSSSCSASAIVFTATTSNGGNTPLIQWFVNNVLAGSGATFLLANPVNGTQVYAKLSSGGTCVNPQTVLSAISSVNCVVTAIPGIDGVDLFEIAPNPTKGLLLVKLKLSQPKMLSFDIVDNQGKTIYSSAGKAMAGVITKSIDLSNRAQGLYYLRVNVGNKPVIQKIVVSR